MKPILTTLLAASALHGLAFAGTAIPEIATPTAAADDWSTARRPITNPTLFDLPLPATQVRPIFIHQNLPDRVNTRLGALDMGGDFQVYALQFEIALTDRLSIVATKDGYVDFNAGNDALWSDQEGFANLGAGLKYAFILDPAAGRAVSGVLTYEAATGNTDVFQGSGDGIVNLGVSALQLIDRWQFAAASGLNIPISDEQSFNGWLSAHVSYETCRWFIPLVEVNWFHVFDAGNGEPRFHSQAGGNVPVVADFEGGDLLNFGAANATRNRDFVTAAIGFRSRLTDTLNFGVAYEIPVTDKEDGILEDRLTLDLVWTF
ncbi:MAG: hypothetical protein QM627_12355 [Luteolibacter sp.]